MFSFFCHRNFSGFPLGRLKYCSMDQNYPSTSSFKGYFVSSACSQYRSATSSYMTFVQRPYRIKRAPEIWSDYQRGRDWGPYHHAAPKLLQDGQWFRGSGSTIALETEFTRESVSGVSEIVVYKTIYKEAPMKWTFSSIIVVALIAFVVMKLQHKLTFY